MVEMNEICRNLLEHHLDSMIYLLGGHCNVIILLCWSFPGLGFHIIRGGKCLIEFLTVGWMDGKLNIEIVILN